MSSNHCNSVFHSSVHNQGQISMTLISTRACTHQ